MSIIKIVQNARLLCTAPKDVEKFRLVYKYPHIQKIGLIGRAKFYYTALTLISTPVATVLTLAKVCPPETAVTTLQIGVIGLVPLYLVGQIVNKFVGILYVNENGDNVKVAHLDFWGRRRDNVIPTADIVPIIEPKKTIRNMFYSKLCRYSSGEYYKLHLPDGIVDTEAFNKTFAP